MVILPRQYAVFICTPKAASQSVSRWLESQFREDGEGGFTVEGLHDYHANLAEAAKYCADQVDLYALWSFCFVRNPYDRFASYCAFTGEEVEAALEKAAIGTERLLYPQVHFAKDVNKVYRFEDLHSAIIDISSRIGGNVSAFEKLNASDSFVKLTREHKQRIAEIYACDFEAFGYEV